MAGSIIFEAPYFPIVGTNNISTFDNLLRHSWADDTHDGQAHSIMLLPGQTQNPILTMDVPQFVHGFTDPGDRGNLFLCPGGQIKVPAGSEYILTVSDMFTCTEASKGILVENGGRIWLSGATVSDAEVGVTARKGSDVESFFTTYSNNYKGMRLDNAGIASIPDIKISFTQFNTFSNTAALKPPYQGMSAPNTTKGYGLEIISHPNVSMFSGGLFRGLNNGVRLFRSSFSTNATFTGIRADAGSSVAHQGWAIWGLGLGVETLFYSGGDIAVLTPGEINDKGVYIQNMNVAMNRVGITADAGISLVNCKLKTVSITNLPTLPLALNCRYYGIKTSNCLPLNAGSIIRGNFINMSNPGNNNPVGTGILLGEGSKVTTKNSIGWIVQNNFIDLDRTRWGIRRLGVYQSGFYNNDIEVLNNSLPEVIGVDVLNASEFTANCNDVHTAAVEFNSKGYLFKNVSQSDYICNTSDQLSTGIEYSVGCEGTTLKGSELNNTPLGLLLRNDVALGTQGLDQMNQIVQDHGNKWMVSSASHQATQASLVLLSRFGVDQTENAAFNPPNNWGQTWFNEEPTPNSLSFSCPSSVCVPPLLAYVKDRNVETAIANGTIYNVGLPGVIPKILENHLYAELQKNPTWAAGNSLFSQFLQSKANTTTSAFWYIHQGIDALNNRTDSEQDAVSAAETTIASLRQSLYLMDSTYASGTAINNVLYRQRLASLSAATATLQTLLDNIRSARLTQAAQLRTQNGAIGTTQTWEQSEQQVNDLEIRLFIQDSVTTAQLTLLDALGSLCPQTNGEGVLRAQVLYNRFVEKEFSPVCTGARGVVGDRAEASFVPVALRLYPNPSTGLVTIPSLNNAMRTIEVYDIAGRLTHRITTPDIEFDLSDLNSGVYLLRIKEEATGKTDSAKLIISK